METLSATSLDVVRDYAAAHGSDVQRQVRGGAAELREGGRTRSEVRHRLQGMAMASRNLDRQQDAEKYIKEALRHLDGMTERERYRTARLFYMITSDYQQCVKEYGELIARYAADASAHNNLALCCDATARHAESGRGDAAGREDPAEARALPSQSGALCGVRRRFSGRGARGASGWTWVAHGDAAVGLRSARSRPIDRGGGNIPGARKERSRWVASYAASGLGDLALYEGRFSDAVRILEQGAAADLASKEPTELRRSSRRSPTLACRVAEKAPAIAAADNALTTQPNREDPIPGGASLRRGWRDGEGPEAGRGPRLRAPSRAAGVRQDHRR